MDSILADQLEWLLSGNMDGIRFKRQLVLLAGCLADQNIPSEIEKQLANLSRRIALEEVFGALLEPVNAYLRGNKEKEAPTFDLSSLMAQIEATRLALNDCDPVNQAVLLSWLLGRAKDRKLLSKIRSSR